MVDETLVDSAPADSTFDSLDIDVEGLRKDVRDLTVEVGQKADKKSLISAAVGIVFSVLLAVGGAFYVNNLRVQAAEDACNRGNILRENIVEFVRTDVIGPNPNEEELAVLARTEQRFARVDCSTID